MDYRTAIEYLYSLGHETLTMKLGLENITRLAERIGRPDRAYKIVHVAGTNGKGSFCAMLASILAQAAIPTGLFTSPHLINIEERFRLNLEPISRDDFSRLMERIKITVDLMLVERALEARPTFFEHVTALGLEYFRERGAELTILEVGLGGRFDSTNIVTPVLSVITPIDFDHQQYLGNTLAAIAGEKAGILKPCAPALAAPQAADAVKVIEQAARSAGIMLHQLDPKLLRYYKAADGYWHFDFTTDHNHYKDVRVGLRGRHQVETAALAILAAEYLAGLDFSITQEQIVTGIGSVKWPGRLEIIPGAPPLLLDGAHNSGGIATLRAFLDDWLAEQQPARIPRTLLFSTMRDKDLLSMAKELFPLFDEVVLVERKDPRAADMLTWQNRLAPLTNRLTLERGASAALSAARAVTPPEGLIVASGSLHLIGELKQLLTRRKA